MRKPDSNLSDNPLPDEARIDRIISQFESNRQIKLYGDLCKSHFTRIINEEDLYKFNPVCALFYRDQSFLAMINPNKFISLLEANYNPMYPNIQEIQNHRRISGSRISPDLDMREDPVPNNYKAYRHNNHERFVSPFAIAFTNDNVWNEFLERYGFMFSKQQLHSFDYFKGAYDSINSLTLEDFFSGGRIEEFHEQGLDYPFDTDWMDKISPPDKMIFESAISSKLEELIRDKPDRFKEMSQGISKPNHCSKYLIEEINNHLPNLITRYCDSYFSAIVNELLAKGSISKDVEARYKNIPHLLTMYGQHRPERLAQHLELFVGIDSEYTKKVALDSIGGLIHSYPERYNALIITLLENDSYLKSFMQETITGNRIPTFLELQNKINRKIGLDIESLDCIHTAPCYNNLDIKSYIPSESFRKSMVDFARQSPELFEPLTKLLTQSTEGLNPNIYKCILDGTVGIWDNNPSKFVEIFTNLQNQKYASGRHRFHYELDELIMNLGSRILNNWKKDKFICNEPEIGQFVSDYLTRNNNSELSSETEILNDLSALYTTKNINFTNLKRIFDIGKVSSIEDMIQLAKIDIRDAIVLNKVNNGAFGTIFNIQDNDSSEVYALKVPNDEIKVSSSMVKKDCENQRMTQTEYIRNRLLHEGKILYCIGPHSNIVAYHGHRKAIINGIETSVLSLENLSNAVSISEYYQRKSFKDTNYQKSLLEHLSSITDVLAYIKDKGVISHNDLHPDNILIMPEGTLKIIDFGHALFEGENPTISGKRTHAPDHNVPAQYADLYMFGVTTYQLMTGETQKLCNTPHSLGYRDPIPPNIEKIDTGDTVFDDSIKSIISKCINRDSEYDISLLRKDLNNLKRHID